MLNGIDEPGAYPALKGCQLAQATQAHCAARIAPALIQRHSYLGRAMR